ncbi:MAG: T9SS type A sorting domain-containing protein [Paludibacter sp.]|nr:T9SS type A sorting domain-containing protein [Paludibacter sp.]
MKTGSCFFQRRIYFFFFICITLSFQLFSQTEITGVISTDSTLTLSSSPYVVPYSLQIAQGATLTIEQGVEIRFGDYVTLVVYGTMNAQGAIFTTNSSSPEPGKWSGIRIGDGNNTGHANLTNCEVKFYQECNIENGQLSLTNSSFLDAGEHGFKIHANGTLQMSGGNIITSSTNASAYGNGIFAHESSTVILSGVTIQNFRHGVAGYKANLSLTDLTIKGAEFPVYFEDTNTFTMTGNNNLESNTFKAVTINFSELNETMYLPAISYPYYFNQGFNVNETGKLTIAPNNVLKFNDYTSLNIKGILQANANGTGNIIMTSIRDDNAGGDTNSNGTVSAPETASWFGIYFQDSSKDSENILRNCQIRYGGRNNRGGINTYNASPVIDSCHLSNNPFGIYLEGTSNPAISNTTIGSSSITPLAMSFEADPVMSNNVLSFSDNAYDAIGIIGGTMSASGTLKVRSFTNIPNITYFLLNEIVIPENITLTINKGITLKSYRHDGNWDKRIIVYGNIIADGTATEMINFTSARDDNYGNPADCNKDGTMTSPEKNDWGGIIFQPGSNGLLNYCRFKYAEINNFSYPNCNNYNNLNYSAIAIIDASPTISNCEFKDLYHAVSCYRAASPTINNCQMINITYTPVNISGTANPTITNIQFTNVGWRAIGLIGGYVCLNGTIQKRNMAGFNNISYVLLNDMVINQGSYITIDPGVVIKTAGYNDYYGNYWYGTNGQHIYVHGGLKSNGTATENVIISSIKDDNAGNPLDTNGDGSASSPQPGNWSYIKFTSGADDAFNTLNYTQIKFGGGGEEQGILNFENAGGTVMNSLIINSRTFGTFINGNASPAFDKVTIQNASSDPIAISLTSNPSFSNMSLISNYSNAIKIIDRDLNGTAVIAPRNIAGIENIAYIIDNLRIHSSGKLTINPGVVIKFRTSNSYILSEGNLIAAGTPDQKIYFTSFKDDSKGGDSNNNGNNDAPERGDWGGGVMSWYGYWDFPPGGIQFRNNTLVSDTANILNHCEIRYSDTGIRIENAFANISNITVQQCRYFGATVIGNSNPTFNDCQFYNLNYSPVELSMFSNPTFNNCSALNVGFMALSVIPETYSRSDTIPVRSFGGYDNISYFMEGSSTINAGTTITIPEGIVFKSKESITSGGYYYSPSYYMANGFQVNGELIVNGTNNHPVVFTHLTDDNYGNPLDSELNGTASAPTENYNDWNGTWINMNDVSNDQSKIKGTIFRYGEMGISTLSASPSILNSRFEKLRCGVNMNGVSSPAIDSCTFNNLRYFPMQISLVAYPASSVGNTMSGSTYKVIKVRDEILTQDVTLPKRNFGGKDNIPYYFENYQIGTSALLNIEPGVICKFARKEWWMNGIKINRGLKAIGGSTPDSLIVFTSIADDFYGGDSNADGNASKPGDNKWAGIYFADESLDPLCALRNCHFRYAEKGITTFSASPSIQSCNFNHNDQGIVLSGASNPLISSCDFSSNTYYGLKNADKSFEVAANNCWWGSNAGPVVTDEETTNYNEREQITSGVNYLPWRNAGAINPTMGDASLNGLIQAYDASLILKHTVQLITLNDQQIKVADVSNNGDVSALDASLILKYVVGIDNTFPVHKVKSAAVENEYPTVSLDHLITDNDETSVEVPIHMTNPVTTFSSDMRIRFNPEHLQLTGIMQNVKNMMMESNFDNLRGTVNIGIASASGFSGTNIPAVLKFNVVSPVSAITELNFEKLLLDEQNYLYLAENGTINILRVNSGINNPVTLKAGINSLSPNPLVTEALLTFTTENDGRIQIELYNLFGQKIKELANFTAPAGTQTIKIKDENLKTGTYILKMRTENNTYSLKFQVIK